MPLSCILWYRTVFEADPPKRGQRVFLNFAGVEWEAEVWLNGAFLGRHQVYYEPFRLDVTAILKERNTLAVRVIAGPRFAEPVFEWPVLPDVPAAQQCYVRDFVRSVPGHRIGMLYAGSGFGIHREVFLETTGAVCASEVFVRGDPRSCEARVAVETNSSIDGECAFEIQLLPENFEGRPFRATETRRVPKGAGTFRFAVAAPARGCGRRRIPVSITVASQFAMEIAFSTPTTRSSVSAPLALRHREIRGPACPRGCSC